LKKRERDKFFLRRQDMKKRNFLRVLLVLGMVLALIMIRDSPSLAQKDFPNREIEIVVPYPPGGSLDLATRIMSEELSKIFRVPLVVVNKAGVSLGAQHVANAKPDGYTLLAGNNVIFIHMPATQTDLPYKTSDFAPIARYATSPNFLLVRKGAPWKTLEELIDYAKKNPGKLTCATSGVASNSHFFLEILNIEAGVNIRHVPFKGGPPANTAALGGHVDLLSSSLSGVFPLLKSGDFRGLAIFSVKRFPAFPEIPTMVEKGYPGTIISAGFWAGLFTPRGVEKTVLEKIFKAVEKAANTPHVVRQLEVTGNIFDYVAGEDLAKDIEKESEKVAYIIKKANLTFK
jgi:tripartite-type tricarboxylate transporter receptor subunit TctC